MPCETYKRYIKGEQIEPEKMAEEGITQDELDLLKLEVELAREIAKKDAFDAVMTKREQDELTDLYVRDAIEVAHDRHHRKQADESRRFFAQLARLAHKKGVH